MIAGLLLAQVLATPLMSAPVASGLTALAPAAVLRRYLTSLAKVKEPRVMTFDYTLSQTGMRTLAQTHRVFRNGGDERDETLTVDGKRLSPPKVRVFRGRRNRYAVSALAPRPADYAFVYVGPRRNERHLDYDFRLTSKAPRAFAVTGVTIDGVRFLPTAITFTTTANDGSGSIAFGRNAAWWVPYFATARATLTTTVAAEQLAFYTYRFPPSLPPSTFSHAGAAKVRHLPGGPLRPGLPQAGPLPPAGLPDRGLLPPTPAPRVPATSPPGSGPRL